MAHEILVKEGDPVVWRGAGGDYAITLASLADDAGRSGAKADLGQKWGYRHTVLVQINLDAAPTAGNVIEIYWAPSHDNSTFPGGVTGSDAAYKSGEEDEWKKQLLLIGCLVVTADADSVVQTQMFVFQPPARYGCPVVINKTGVAFEGDNDAHQITLTPLVEEVQ